jgi:hypothetical protein
MSIIVVTFTGAPKPIKKEIERNLQDFENQNQEQSKELESNKEQEIVESQLQHNSGLLNNKLQETESKIQELEKEFQSSR